MNLQLTAMNLQVTKKSKSRLIPGLCNDDYFIWTLVCQAALIHYPGNKTGYQQHLLDMFGFEYVEYYQIVRDLIEEYRLLFIDWVAGFDKWDYIIYRWGLFNPPGVGPFDKDPDRM